MSRVSWLIALLFLGCGSTSQLSVNGKKVYSLATDCGTVQVSSYSIQSGIKIRHTFEGEYFFDPSRGLMISSSGIPAIPIKEITFKINQNRIDSENLDKPIEMGRGIMLNEADTLEASILYDVPFYEINQNLHVNPSSYLFCDGKNIGSQPLQIKIGRPNSAYGQTTRSANRYQK